MRSLAFAGVLAFLIPSSPVLAADAKGLIQLGDFLLEQKRYREALYEFQRAMFLDLTLRSEINVERMFRSGILSSEFQYVIAITQDVRFFESPLQFSCQRSFFRARALYGLENYRDATNLFSNLPNCTEALWQDRGLYYAGLSELRGNNWKEASRYFGLVSPTSEVSQRAIHAKTVSLDGENLPFRSPKRAALFATVLPGAGYLYADLPQTALAAFVTNSAFILGTAISADRGETGLAVAAGLFSFAWYFGNIRGSAQAMARRNSRLSNRFVSQFELD